MTYARVRLAHDGGSRGWLPERFFDPAAAVGGALTDLGCHPVYLVQRFLGSTPQTVSASYGSQGGRAVEDNAVVTARLPRRRAGGDRGELRQPSSAFTHVVFGGPTGSLGFVEGAGLWLSVRRRIMGRAGRCRSRTMRRPVRPWVGHITDGTRADRQPRPRRRADPSGHRGQRRRGRRRDPGVPRLAHRLICHTCTRFPMSHGKPAEPGAGRAGSRWQRRRRAAIAGQGRAHRGRGHRRLPTSRATRRTRTRSP